MFLRVRDHVRRVTTRRRVRCARACPACCRGQPPRDRVRRAHGARVRLSCQTGMRFARSYFYPDMPKNFQTSQYEEPVAGTAGSRSISRRSTRRIGIERLHLERRGKSCTRHARNGAGESRDFTGRRPADGDRLPAGAPLSRRAAAYLKAFRAVLVSLGVCDGNMEEGSLRCDANVSLRRPARPRSARRWNQEPELVQERQAGTRIRGEAPVRALDRGDSIVQETRLWDAGSRVHASMRSKEYAHDYRYFPEPDLVPLRFDPAWVDGYRRRCRSCRAPTGRARRPVRLPPYDADVLTQCAAVLRGLRRPSVEPLERPRRSLEVSAAALGEDVGIGGRPYWSTTAAGGRGSSGSVARIRRPRGFESEWHEVRLREVTIVVRVLLQAHRPRVPRSASRARLLHDRITALERGGLALHLEFECLLTFLNEFRF